MSGFALIESGSAGKSGQRRGLVQPAALEKCSDWQSVLIFLS